MWLKEFKIALIEKDIGTLTQLMDSVPKLNDAKEIDEALYLLKAATSLVEMLRDETQLSMVQMQKNITFMKATQEEVSHGSLDIQS